MTLRIDWAVASRFSAAIVGGYAFAYGFVGVATLAGFCAGLGFFEAQTLAQMLGFLVYLGALLYGFVARRTARVWLSLGGGGAVMGLLSWTLSRAML